MSWIVGRAKKGVGASVLVELSPEVVYIIIIITIITRPSSLNFEFVILVMGATKESYLTIDSK